MERDQITMGSPPSISRGNHLQVLSDLHLDVGQQYATFSFPATAPYLILAGDVGRLVDYVAYLKFVHSQVSRYEKVFLVLGNHEFHGLTYESGIQEAQRLAQEPSLYGKVVLLHQGRWDDPNSTLTILGCTLWSAIPDHAHQIVESRIKDYKRISQWTVQKHNHLHTQEAAWLRQTVAQIVASSSPDGTPNSKERRILVVTYHAPCIEGSSRPEQSENAWTCAFATDLLKQQRWDCVRAWVFGHTHYSTTMEQNGIKIVANQRGYVLPGAENSPKLDHSGKDVGDAHEFDAAMVITI